MSLGLPEGKGDPIREEFLLGPVDRLGGLVEPETRVRILVQARIFSLKLLIYDLRDGYSES